MIWYNPPLHVFNGNHDLSSHWTNLYSTGSIFRKVNVQNIFSYSFFFLLSWHEGGKHLCYSGANRKYLVLLLHFFEVKRNRCVSKQSVCCLVPHNADLRPVFCWVMAVKQQWNVLKVIQLVKISGKKQNHTLENKRKKNIDILGLWFH